MPAVSVLDYFKGDAFSIANMSLAIQKYPYQPTWLDSLKLFKPGPGLTGKVAQLEYGLNSVRLVAASAWGDAMKTVSRDATRKLYPINVPHLTRHDHLLADSLAGVRAFGTGNETQTWDNAVADKQQRHRKDFDLTLDFHKLKLLTTGKILDADGSTVLVDLFTLLGISQSQVFFDLAGTPNIKGTMRTVHRAMANALGNEPMRGIIALCSDTFFDTLLNLAEIKTAFAAWQGSAQMLQNQQVDEFTYAGVRWKNITGSIGGSAIVAANECALIPDADIWYEDYAPADTIETVNTLGQPFYSWMTEMEDSRGMNMYFQCNPIHLCSHPGAIFRGRASAS